MSKVTGSCNNATGTDEPGLLWCSRTAYTKSRTRGTLRGTYTVILFLSRFLDSSINDPQLHPLSVTAKTFLRHGDLDLWPVTLTFKLDLDILPLNLNRHRPEKNAQKHSWGLLGPQSIVFCHINGMKTISMISIAHLWRNFMGNLMIKNNQPYT